MTEQEFLDVVLHHAETYYIQKDEKHPWRSPTMMRRSGKQLKDINLEDVIRTQWTTGGVGGGNCWSDGGHYAMTGEPEPEFEALDTLLNKLCPDITYLQYKQLTKGLVDYEDYTEREYYGNSTTYGVKTVKLQKLYERLTHMQLI